MNSPTFPIDEAGLLPAWRRPEALLVVMTVAMTLAFATWTAALNNFVVEAAAFSGLDIGTLHMFREVPGFLSFLVVFLLAFVAEQRLAFLALGLLGVGTMVVADFPSWWGLMLTTLISSIGFHYFEAVNQSLQLQWLPKGQAPRALGRIVSAGAAISMGIYAVLMIGGWWFGGVDYDIVYTLGGGACAVLALSAWLVYPHFRAPHAQTRQLVLRPRYWLYYALVFMGGARRQIFVIFAAFMMVERFGFRLHEVTALFLVTYGATMVSAPWVGRLIARLGERQVLMIEYAGLIGVFLAYAGVYYLELGLIVAMALYVLDHVLFKMAFAQKTYFQKIADPADHAPTAAVAFTINHIAAVTLPVPLGMLWLAQPGQVYVLAASMAGVSLLLSMLVPRHPEPGRETVLSGLFAPTPRPAE
jgi:predicted MFS family arabinose efflux permease